MNIDMMKFQKKGGIVQKNTTGKTTAEIEAMAESIFDDPAAAQIWLHSANSTFAGLSPIDYLASDAHEPAAAVLLVLNAIATGGAT